MTPLIRARHHAQVVEDLEPCAPEVQSRYLREAIERCKLPISVWYEADGQEWLSGRDGWVISYRSPNGWEHHCSPSQSTVGLKLAYLDLVSTLESAAPSSADTAAADPASFSPEDAL